MNSLERLELSRTRLRTAMAPDTHLPPSTDRSSAWLKAVRDTPAVAVVLDAVGAWWRQHPARLVVEAAADAVRTAARPLAQHRPLVLVGIAALGGGLLMWSRPWRWLAKPALFTGLAPQLLSRVLASLPLESWLGLVATPPPEPMRSPP